MVQQRLATPRAAESHRALTATASGPASPCRLEPSRPDVSKHDGEEEGEEDDGKGAGVDLAVSRDAVRVHEALEARGESRRADVRGGRVVASRQQVDDGLGVAARARTRPTQRELELVHLRRRHPPLGHKDLSVRVVREHVESMQRRLLSLDDERPRAEAGGDGGEATLLEEVGVADELTHLHHLHLEPRLQRLPRARRLGELVHGRAKVLADL